MSDADRDLRAIIELMLEYREQLPAGLYPDPDPDFALANLRLWHREGDLIPLVAWDGDRAKGCLLGVVNACYWTPGRRMATDMIFYVRPDYRGGSTGGRLLLDFERQCLDRGVRSIEMNNVSPEHYEMVEAMYLRAGYRLTCKTYEKDLA